MGHDIAVGQFDVLLAKAQELIAVSAVKRLEAMKGDYVVIEFAENISPAQMAIIAQRWRPVLVREGLVPIFIPHGCRVTGFIPAMPEPEVEGEMDEEELELELKASEIEEAEKA